MKCLKQNVRGSIAVEAALIVPIVIIVVMLVIYILMIIFQTCIMQITANSIAERVAAINGYKHASFISGKIAKAEISSLDIYRRWNTNDTLKQSEFKAAAVEELQRNSILKSKNCMVDIYYDNQILNQKVTVVLRASYENPVGAFASIWGGETELNLAVSAESTIDDPVEFIRNSDFILEAASKIPLISEFQDKWQEIIKKIIEYVNRFTKEKWVTNGQ